MRLRGRGRRHRRWLGALLVVAAVAGCAGLTQAPPTPGPASFPELTGQLGRFGVDVLSWTSGDAGCADPSLAPTAIRFTVRGLDQPTEVVLRIYIFRDRDAWQRRQADVDTCAAAWATDPATFVIIQTSPYVLTGQGPWTPAFDAAVRRALVESAGNGG